MDSKARSRVIAAPDETPEGRPGYEYIPEFILYDWDKELRICTCYIYYTNLETGVQGMKRGTGQTKAQACRNAFLDLNTRYWMDTQ